MTPESGDYSHDLGSGHTLTFSNGASSRSFAVTAETDPDNADEEVTLGFGTPLPEEVRAGSPAGAAVTLADGAPSPPTDVRLRPASPQGHTRLTVSWTPPAEAVSGYEYRIQGSGSPPSAAASPATISGLEPGTGYRVQVRARNRYGSSGWASGSGRTNANRRPDIAGPGEESVPENTTSVGDYTKSDPDGDATRWLELGGTHASRFDFSAGSLRFRRAPDYERDPHSYEVTVRATDGYDVTEHEVTVDVIDVPRPEAPTASLSVPSSNGHERLDASWTVPASESPITGYELEYCYYASRDDGGPSSQDPPSDPGGTAEEERSPGICSTRPESGNSAILADLYDNTLYGVRVRATSGEGPGSWSNQATASTRRRNRAPRISGETAPSVAENSRSVGDYTKSDPDGDATRWLELGGTHASRFDFSAGSLRFRRAPDYERDPHSYEVTVRATDGYDVREHEVTVDVIDVPPPPRPDVTVTVPSGNGHEQLDVRWSVSSSGATVTGWKLQYCQTNACGSTTTLTFEAGTANTTLENLRSGTRYSVRVKATSDEGDSPWSPIQRTYTPGQHGPGDLRTHIQVDPRKHHGRGLLYGHRRGRAQHQLVPGGIQFRPVHQQQRPAELRLRQRTRLRKRHHRIHRHRQGHRQRQSQGLVDAGGDRHGHGRGAAQPDDGREGECAFVRDGHAERQLDGSGQRRPDHGIHHAILLLRLPGGRGSA